MLKRLSILEKVSVEENIRHIQLGDKEKQNEFIANYIPFIKGTTAKVCKRYIGNSNDEEFSIALIAFNEAIEQFSPSKGCSFLSFASLVMRRRIIDYIRYEQRRRVTLSLDYEEQDKEKMENVIEIKASFKEYEKSLEAEYRREEIIHLQEQLKLYRITIVEVAEQSPKHRDARDNMLKIAKIVITHDELKKFLIDKKRLPLKKLATISEMSRKTMERNRKYIITLCIIMMEDYQYLQDYIKEWIS
ncbi:RNA polymerase sigma-I factor [Evansella sp. AB-rgal1]|uniref:RNA polymerase sigma-I factor n=1 Tax=Evansella sp. AB-rgal1 TaxID=3242696 RepID=UPI00359E54BB